MQRVIAVHGEPQTKRLIYHCKRCGYTLTRDIQYKVELSGEYGTEEGAFPDYHYTTIAEKRMDCPTCSKSTFKRSIKANAVEGHFNPDHECDSECLHATSVKCSCGCGGANHGSKYLAPQAVA